MILYSTASRGGKTRPDPIFYESQTDPTRPDPTQDQMAFNPIEIYQRSEKTQHVN
jgi:hypothetical protein